MFQDEDGLDEAIAIGDAILDAILEVVEPETYGVGRSILPEPHYSVGVMFQGDDGTRLSYRVYATEGRREVMSSLLNKNEVLGRHLTIIPDHVSGENEHKLTGPILDLLQTHGLLD